MKFIHRLIGAAALDAATYEEVEGDRTATAQAFLVVLASSLASGIGATGFGSQPAGAIAIMSIAALLGWAGWALLVYQIGGRLMPERDTSVDVPQLLRTIGFAATPGILRVFGVLPGVTIPVFTVTAIWMLATMVVAVRQALDYRSTARALAVCGIGWALAVTIALGLGLVFGPAVS